MLPDGRRIGTHLPLGQGLVRAADRAVAIGASTVQVFTDNPTAWRRRPTLPRELPAFRARLAAHDIAPVVVHAPYLVNLAGPEPASWERSVTVMANELRVAAAWGAVAVNLHVGSHRGTGPDDGTRRLVEGIARVLEEVEGEADEVAILLENGTGGGFGMGATVEELCVIDRTLRSAGIDQGRYGFCLDVAHLWGAGYPVDQPEGVDRLLSQVDVLLRLERVRVIHLNDSRSERGSRADRHEHLAAGRIGAAGLGRFLRHPGLAHAAYVLETPGMDAGYDAVNLRRAADLAVGRTPPPLPPEAFAIQSTRARTAPAERDDDPPAAGGTSRPDPATPRRPR
jgi:deoxyribonuclease-4